MVIIHYKCGFISSDPKIINIQVLVKIRTQFMFSALVDAFTSFLDLFSFQLLHADSKTLQQICCYSVIQLLELLSFQFKDKRFLNYLINGFKMWRQTVDLISETWTHQNWLKTQNFIHDLQFNKTTVIHKHDLRLNRTALICSCQQTSNQTGKQNY